MSDLVLPDARSRDDLATFVARARRVDPDGAVRLVASGRVLAVYVSPVHGGGGPTVLGLRAVPLVVDVELDRTVALSALTDRLARRDGDAGPVTVPVPPMDAADAGWAGVSPPRVGWHATGALDPAGLAQAVRAGIDEIAAGAPEGSGAQAVGRVRAMVWGRDLDGVAGVPAGAAFAADALGFVTAGDPVTLHECGPWRRLSTAHGHVLARRALL